MQRPRGWVEQGRNGQYVLVPATDRELVDAWFRLWFGAQHAAGIQETPENTDDAPQRVIVRRAAAEDAEADRPGPRPAPPPSAGARLRCRADGDTEEESREEFLKEVDDPEEGLFVAEIDGQSVALLSMVPIERRAMHTGLARPERAAFLGFAATLPEARGSGVGLALTNAGFAWAREQGYQVMVIDWRETNLLASRFWPRRGFRRTFLRLYRSIP